jgi:hypothetical protein
LRLAENQRDEFWRGSSRHQCIRGCNVLLNTDALPRSLREGANGVDHSSQCLPCYRVSPTRRIVMRRLLKYRYAAYALGVSSLAGAFIWIGTTRNPVTGQSGAGGSKSIYFRAPAGTRPTTRHINVDGFDAAILPNGRLLTTVGIEVPFDAPKPYGLALSPGGAILATINSGASRFSISLVRNLTSPTPTVSRINVSATFMGITFSADGSRTRAQPRRPISLRCRGGH